RVRAYHLPDMKPAFEVATADKERLTTGLSPNAGVAISADRKRLAVFTGSAVRVLDSATGEVLRTTAPYGSPAKTLQCRGVAFSPSGDTLAAVLHPVGAAEPVLARFDVTTGELKGSTPL